MVSVGAGQIIRLGKSLILSRLLFPDAYGVMAIVWAVLYALAMLSDVGLSQGVIRHARGNDPDFLNTAWTMKVIRGAVLCAFAMALAYPLSLFYQKPELGPLIAVAGLTLLIDGFGSTNLFSSQRNMVYGRVTLLELTHDIIGLLVTLAWAYFYPSPWALLGGAIVGRSFHLIGSHKLLPGIKNRFHWDPAAFRELAHFGKWIFFSSAIYLIYAQGDRMLLGVYFDSTLLGIYSVAIMLSEAVGSVVYRLNEAVIYPALSRVVNNERARLKEVYYRLRLGSDILLIIPISILMVIGDLVVGILYDSRYHEAGWMLQVLCVKLLMITMLSGCSSCLFALGHSRYSLVQNIFRAAWIVIGIPVAWHIAGTKGVVWIVALTELPVVAVLWFGMIRYKLLSVWRELRSLLFVAIGIVIGFGLLQLPISGR